MFRLVIDVMSLVSSALSLPLSYFSQGGSSIFAATSAGTRDNQAEHGSQRLGGGNEMLRPSCFISQAAGRALDFSLNEMTTRAKPETRRATVAAVGT